MTSSDLAVLLSQPLSGRRLTLRAGHTVDQDLRELVRDAVGSVRCDVDFTVKCQDLAGAGVDCGDVAV